MIPEQHSLILVCLVAIDHAIDTALASSSSAAAAAAVPGGGWLMVEFLEYRNPSGNDAGGHCCDGKYGICQHNGCDYVFDICLDQSKRTRGSTSNPVAAAGGRCSYGRLISSRIENQDNIDFAKTSWNLTNPIVFQFQSQIPSSVQLKVRVEDYDSGKYWTGDNDFVDSFEKDLRLEAVDPGQWVHDTIVQRTRLLIRYVYMCVNGTCGSLCKEFCRALPLTETQPVNQSERWINGSDIGYTVDCQDLAVYNRLKQNGVYYVNGIEGSMQEKKVYCHISTNDGNVWTVIQRRKNGRENFNRNWTDYRNGFWTMEPDDDDGGEFWIGLETIHQMTKRHSYTLRIQMTLSDGERRFADYDKFDVGDEESSYRLHVGSYKGNAGDGLKFRGLSGCRNHQDIPFSTPDKDNDRWTDGSCAQKYESGWWFNDCYWVNLNGRYLSPSEGWPYCFLGLCISWRALDRLSEYSLRQTRMAILRNSASATDHLQP